jgi:hypothetical protein
VGVRCPADPALTCGPDLDGAPPIAPPLLQRPDHSIARHSNDTKCHCPTHRHSDGRPHAERGAANIVVLPVQGLQNRGGGGGRGWGCAFGGVAAQLGAAGAQQGCGLGEAVCMWVCRVARAGV